MHCNLGNLSPFQLVDRALRRAMFCCRGYAAIICHRPTERSIHLAAQPLE